MPEWYWAFHRKTTGKPGCCVNVFSRPFFCFGLTAWKAHVYSSNVQAEAMLASQPDLLHAEREGLLWGRQGRASGLLAWLAFE